MRRSHQGHYSLDTPSRSVAGAVGWFSLGFLMGVLAILALGLYLAPVKARAWIDPTPHAMDNRR
jgi:hypothetical protein